MPAITQIAQLPPQRSFTQVVPWTPKDTLPPPPVTTTTPPTCACTNTYNLQVEQGATLSSQITITLDGAPVDVTGSEFQFTAKLNPSDADTAPTTIQIDWQETSTPTQGITWLTIPAATTQTMQLVGYSYQIRMVSSGGVVTPIARGVLTIVQPVSTRFS
jgi:hypothetical protein